MFLIHHLGLLLLLLRLLRLRLLEVVWLMLKPIIIRVGGSPPPLPDALSPPLPVLTLLTQMKVSLSLSLSLYARICNVHLSLYVLLYVNNGFFKCDSLLGLAWSNLWISNVSVYLLFILGCLDCTTGLSGFSFWFCGDESFNYSFYNFSFSWYLCGCLKMWENLGIVWMDI
jgi:hypothetical protein